MLSLRGLLGLVVAVTLLGASAGSRVRAQMGELPPPPAPVDTSTAAPPASPAEPAPAPAVTESANGVAAPPATSAATPAAPPPAQAATAGNAAVKSGLDWPTPAPSKPTPMVMLIGVGVFGLGYLISFEVGLNLEAHADDVKAAPDGEGVVKRCGNCNKGHLL